MTINPNVPVAATVGFGRKDCLVCGLIAVLMRIPVRSSSDGLKSMHGKGQQRCFCKETILSCALQNAQNVSGEWRDVWTYQREHQNSHSQHELEVARQGGDQVCQGNSQVSSPILKRRSWSRSSEAAQRWWPASSVCLGKLRHWW